METIKTNEPEYAGFWLRVAAALIDGAIIGVATMFIFLIFFAFIGISIYSLNSMQLSKPQEVGTIISMVLAYIGLILTIIIMNWLYFAIMESSKGATIGKSAVGITVTDMQGNKISFWRATGRHFGKIISGFFYIGYIMVAFTDKNQGLHDMMADCLVIKKNC